MYDVCLDCYSKPPRRQSRANTVTVRETKTRYRPERSRAWDKKDSDAARFFVYILKLEGGEYYAGQTRELRERLSEHRDGQVQSTKGRNPKLVWFGQLPTRDAAATTEVELKKLVDSNPRQIRRMVISFKDLANELDYS